jgi:hypothetical protein
MPTYRTTIEVDCVVHYTAYPFIKGSFEPGGLQIEPDEPAYIGIDWVEFPTTHTCHIDELQMARLREEIAEYLTEQSQPQED